MGVAHLRYSASTGLGSTKNASNFHDRSRTCQSPLRSPQSRELVPGLPGSTPGVHGMQKNSSPRCHHPATARCLLLRLDWRMTVSNRVRPVFSAGGLCHPCQTRCSVMRLKTEASTKPGPVTDFARRKHSVICDVVIIFVRQFSCPSRGICRTLTKV
jgi:hypothetical protein